MIAGSVAKRYAKALVDVAASGNELEIVRQELSDVAALLREHRELQRFLVNPSILRRDKVRILEEVIARLSLRPLTKPFLRILQQAGRLQALEGVLRAYETMVDERLGRVKAVVTTAAPLEGEAHERLRQRLAEMTGKTVYLEVQLDTGLLGGLLTQIGSQVYDGSLRTRLTRLRQELVRS